MSAHLVTTEAKARLCPRCAEPILVGVSQGLTVRVDPYPLAAELEVVAIIAGREVYSLHARMLVRRLGNSAVSGPLLVSHRCGHILRVPPPPAKPDCFVPPF